jgi:hypothetical protein
MPLSELEELNAREHEQKLAADRLRDEMLRLEDAAAVPGALERLRRVEEELAETGRLRVRAQAKSGHGVIVNTKTDTGLLGSETTGIDAQIELRMAQLPTSIAHLLNPQLSPLVTARVRNARTEGAAFRLRFTSFIEGYSARAVDTVELNPLRTHDFGQLPTLFPARVGDLNELTRATLNVMIEDLDAQRVELHKTKPVWLLPRTSATMAVKEPSSGLWQDLTPYLGAYVTPNAPEVQEFQAEIREHHQTHTLQGYQGGEAEVEAQVKAVYDALKSAAFSYTNSVVAFSPDEGAFTQRVRLPRESLKGKSGNCIDGTVLFASLLESISLNPAIVIIPRHAFVGWQTTNDGDEWKFVDTTRLRTDDFAGACRWAEGWANFYKGLPYNTLYKELPDSRGDKSLLRLWSLRHLRTRHQIIPME